MEIKIKIEITITIKITIKIKIKIKIRIKIKEEWLSRQIGLVTARVAVYGVGESGKEDGND